MKVAASVDSVSRPFLEACAQIVPPQYPSWDPMDQHMLECVKLQEAPVTGHKGLHSF